MLCTFENIVKNGQFSMQYHLKGNVQVRIGSIFQRSKLWKAKFSILCDAIFLVRLQGKFDIDHSGVKGLKCTLVSFLFSFGFFTSDHHMILCQKIDHDAWILKKMKHKSLHFFSLPPAVWVNYLSTKMLGRSTKKVTACLPCWLFVHLHLTLRNTASENALTSIRIGIK